MTLPPLPSARWLPYARRDWSRASLPQREHDPDGAGLHLQQSVEKYLKGWLLDRGWRLLRTHEVDRLIDDASMYDLSLQSFRILGARLSSYYLLERYPTPSPSGPSEAQITSDLVEARQLIGTLFPGEQL
jgi:HEPN domain-containing protein